MLIYRDRVTSRRRANVATTNWAAVKGTRRQAATLSDVATQAGVDTSTVSRVLSGAEGARVSDATRLRILDAAAALNYRPNVMARGLRTARTRTIGLIVPEINSTVFAEIIAGATAAARAQDYTLLIGEQEEGKTIDDPLYTRLARANQIDGLVIAPRRRDDRLASRLGALHIPVVVAHSKVSGIPFCVTIDSFAATRRMVTHLLECGHRRVAYLARRAVFYNDLRRLAGFRAALRAADIAIDEGLILHTPHTFDDALINMERLLAKGLRRPTAVFTVSLITAAGAMKAIDRAGLSVPQDVSIVTLYDHEFAPGLTPPVTTMRMPREDVGNVAARMMVDLLEGRDPKPDVVLPPGDLIMRGSVAPPR
jgi:LacI family transcriptional regulator